MKLLIMTNDPVQGSELADHLRATGHFVQRAWSAGEALVLVRTAPPALAIIDHCHGEDPEASRLARYLLERRVPVLWLGQATDLPTSTSDVAVAVLEPPCDPASVAMAVETHARRTAVS